MKTNSLRLEVSQETLAAGSLPEPIGLDAAKQIARLAYLIVANENRRSGFVTSLAWEDYLPPAQDAIARGVIRTVQALILLGYIES